MQTVLIVIHLMIVVALVVVVLLQRSEGGALGVGGGSGFMTGRGQANVLTRATAILATLFFITSLSLTLWANYGSGNRSILQNTPAGPAEPAPANLPPMGQGSVLDQLKKIEQQRATPAAGNATKTPPAAPAPTTPKAEAPKAEAPKAEVPKAETPKAETPATPPAANETPKPPAEPTGVPDKPANEAAPTPSSPAPAAPK